MIILFPEVILITAAIIPAAVLLVYIFRSDKLDKEPPELLISLVLQGIIATLAALVTERLGVKLLGSFFPEDSTEYNLLLYFIVVGLSEEGFKYILLKRRTWNSPAFNCQYDGVVYATFVSLGFALWENISYVMMYGLGTAAIRAITAVPGHACFGVFMGAFYGLAKRYEGIECKRECSLFRFLAVLCPVLLHGGYDYLASLQSGDYAWVFWPFIILMFAFTFLMVKRLSKDDRFIRQRDSYYY